MKASANSHRRTTPSRCSCGKRQFNKNQARRSAALRNKTDERGQVWSFYKCPFDSKIWHVGKPTGRETLSREIAREATSRNRIDHPVAVRPAAERAEARFAALKSSGARTLR